MANMYNIVCSYLQSLGLKALTGREYAEIIDMIDQSDKVAAIKWLRNYIQRTSLYPEMFLSNFNSMVSCNNKFLLFMQNSDVQMKHPGRIMELRTAKDIIDILFELHRDGFLDSDFIFNPK